MLKLDGVLFGDEDIASVGRPRQLREVVVVGQGQARDAQARGFEHGEEALRCGNAGCSDAMARGEVRKRLAVANLAAHPVVQRHGVAQAALDQQAW